MYVWVDALTTYMTGVGFADDQDSYDRFWPADVHLIGKDIVRFHAVYWPAFLMSAGSAFRNRYSVTASCSPAARKCPNWAMSSIRWISPSASGSMHCAISFCARCFGQDGSYSNEAIVNRVNAELANSFGNLAQRSLSMIFKNWTASFPRPARPGRWGAARQRSPGLRLAGK